MYHTLSKDVAERLKGRPLLLLFDLDGTLSPIAQHFKDASVPAETRQALAALAAQVGTHVALVTGRGAADARRRLPGVPAWVVGNHGCEVLDPADAMRISPLAEPYRDAVAAASRALRAAVVNIPGAIIEDKTWTLSVHYRLAAEDAEAPLGEIVNRVAAENGLRVMPGKKIYEVRPPITVDKGTAVIELATALGGLAPGASVFFAGDDVTDEDAFIALRRATPRAVTVRVSDEDPATLRTAAEFVARDPKMLGEFLTWLAKEPGNREQRTGN